MKNGAVQGGRAQIEDKIVTIGRAIETARIKFSYPTGYARRALYLLFYVWKAQSQIRSANNDVDINFGERGENFARCDNRKR